MNKILILANHFITLYSFRLELIEKLINKGYSVYLSLPKNDKNSVFKELGCNIREIDIQRHGRNPFKDIKLIKDYRNLIREISPDIILSYTIKPNLYGSIASKKTNITLIANVTGLGTSLEKSEIQKKIIIQLYKYSFKTIGKVFVQNSDNKDFFIKNNIAINKLHLLPGSGVNIEKFSYLEYPNNEIITILYIGRMMKDKGIQELIDASNLLVNDNVKFILIGFCENEFINSLKKIRSSSLEFIGFQADVKHYLKKADAVILPSYHEGMANVLLEASSCGRPVLGSNISGIKEIIDDGITGFLFNKKDHKDLAEKVQLFCTLNYEQRKKMGLFAREKVEKEFDRRIVVEQYLKTIEELGDK